MLLLPVPLLPAGGAPVLQPGILARPFPRLFPLAREPDKRLLALALFPGTQVLTDSHAIDDTRGAADFKLRHYP